MLYDIIYMKYPEKVNLEREKKLVVARGWEGNSGESLLNGYGLLFGDENILELEMVTIQHCECTKHH